MADALPLLALAVVALVALAAIAGLIVVARGYRAAVAPLAETNRMLQSQLWRTQRAILSVTTANGLQLAQMELDAEADARRAIMEPPRPPHDGGVSVAFRDTLGGGAEDEPDLMG